MDAPTIIQALKRTGELLEWPTPVEILIVGGAAGIVTSQFRPTRGTIDCDVILCRPVDGLQVVLKTAKKVEAEMGLPPDWLNSRVADLNILPDGWHTRRVLMGTYGMLKAYFVGRLDLLAMKSYANRERDREDIADMKPNREELAFIRTYLNMLRVPSRKADLDQLAGAVRRLAALEEELGRD